MHRYRIRYSKSKNLKYTGNLDIQKIWERSIRRSNLPLAYTKGFHPQPKMNQALPLPLGFTSNYELIDIWFDCLLDEKELKESLSNKLQQGLEIISLSEIPIESPKIQVLVHSVVYECFIPDTILEDKIRYEIECFLSKSNLQRTRRGKTYNLRPLIISLALSRTPDNIVVKMELCAKPGHTGRPDEVISTLGIDPSGVIIHRTRIELEEVN